MMSVMVKEMWPPSSPRRAAGKVVVVGDGGGDDGGDDSGDSGAKHKHFFVYCCVHARVNKLSGML